VVGLYSNLEELKGLRSGQLDVWSVERWMVAFVYPLIIEAVALTAAFAILRLTFWMRDRRRQTQRVRDAGATSFSVLADPQPEWATLNS
jgi:hypothetical protein